MVSKNPNPGEGLFMDPTGMALPGLGPFAVNSTKPAAGPASATSSTTLEDPSKKIRKPYTITKSRESWTEPEHDKFLEALQLFDRDWKKIEAFIGSKTAIQIRSHAQKYFLKVEKSGTTVHLPPPRPKRKAAHAYPQKASKNASILSQTSGSFQSSALPEPGYILRPDSLSKPMNSIGSAAASSWTNNVPIVYLPNQSKGSGMPKNCCSSSESTPGANKTAEAAEKENQGHPLRVLPDFVQVYNFIGSVFDPNVTGHLQKLKQMDPIDVETVLLLMRNLSTNLASPNFDVHRRVLSSYEIDADIAGADKNVIQAALQLNIA